MKVIVKSSTCDIEAEGDTHQDIFRRLSQLQEVFSEESCGCCGSTLTRYRHRQTPDPKPGSKKVFDYYERVCQKIGCRARLAYGQHGSGETLFPKRKDSDGNWLPNNGWERFKKEGETDQTSRYQCLQDLLAESQNLTDLQRVGQMIGAESGISKNERDALRALWAQRKAAITA